NSQGVSGTTRAASRAGGALQIAEGATDLNSSSGRTGRHRTRKARNCLSSAMATAARHDNGRGVLHIVSGSGRRSICHRHRILARVVGPGGRRARIRAGGAGIHGRRGDPRIGGQTGGGFQLPRLPNPDAWNLCDASRVLHVRRSNHLDAMLDGICLAGLVAVVQPACMVHSTSSASACFRGDLMLRAVPKSLFSADYLIERDGTRLGDLKLSQSTTTALLIKRTPVVAFQLQGLDYELSAN